MREITIDPITRLEGHGKIAIFLNEDGDVERAFLQIPELRGFEKFCEGRPAEEMPRITPRICGVCPTAHHIASTKALDDLFQVEPPRTARMIRELLYNSFVIEDHLFHFFFLGAPEFFVGFDAPAGERNILGVISKLGIEAGRRIIEGRKRCRRIMALIGGKPIPPVCGLPGGVSKPIKEEEKKEIKESTEHILEFAREVLKLFHDKVIKNKRYLDLIAGDIYKHNTYYMGLVDKKNRVNFYDGELRVVDPDGKEFVRFKPSEYLDHIEEHTEPWTYMRFSYLKNIGWKGFRDGKESGVFRVAPLARLNASDGMATPLAQGAYEEMYDILGGKPAHNTLAFHWARLIEVLYAAEHINHLAEDPGLTDPNVRNIPEEIPDEGIGVVEAPRGTLIHHFKTDEKGILKEVNLIVGTQNNAAAINMSVEQAAKAFIKKGKVSDNLLNMVEVAFRAYDPCMACATHSLPGKIPLEIKIHSFSGEVIKTIRR